MKKIFKIVSIFCVGVIFLLAFYWIKCQVGIDLFKSFHVGDYLPVQKFQRMNSLAYANEFDYLLNDNFEYENTVQNWSPIWMREEGKVEVSYDQEKADKSRYLVIKNKSKKDWAYQINQIVKVKKGEIFHFEGYAKILGRNVNANFSVVLYDSEKKVINWHYAKESILPNNEWIKLSRRFMVPDGVAYIRFRLTGLGEGSFYFDDIIFQKIDHANVEALQPVYTLDSNVLKYEILTEKKEITVLDKRANKKWKAPFIFDEFLVTGIEQNKNQSISVHIVDYVSLSRYQINIKMSQEAGEIDFEIQQLDTGNFKQLDFPTIFDLDNSMKAVIPVNEGLLLPIDKISDVIPTNLRYGGRWPMPFMGVLDGEAGWMEIVETPNDFEIRLIESKGNRRLTNRWISEKNKIGYNRHIKFVFLDSGGYGAMAKRYRQYASGKGLLVKLRDKNLARQENINKLIGAVDVWYWGINSVDLAKEMFKSGIKKAIFSNTDKWDLKTINKLDFLTSKYDIYQDVWPPIYHDVTKRHDGWPEDLILDENGNWIKGWVLKRELKEYPGGIVCSIPGQARAKETISADIAKHPYTARYIDTVTASPWRECYNEKHPTTRSQDIEHKMELLNFCSSSMKLVTSSEDGVDVAVPYVDYLEGIMSIGKGRLPGSGRSIYKVAEIKPTDEFLEYQVGVDYRIPLWELVYHDGVVTTWFGGDSSNRVPEVWWRRDLFNILYGNMSFWAIRDYAHWRQYKARFIESYENVSPIFEKVGYEEMLSHRFVTTDHTIQETIFSGNMRIIVNFGKSEALLKNGYKLPSQGYVVFQNDKVWKEGICS